jgi:5S rRNA maturation endonuclease (ribonuclease M5)
MGTPGTRTSRSPRNPYEDQGRLHALQIMLCSRLDELLAELSVRLHRNGKMYVGCCPIHGGNNHGAVNLYRKGETRPGYWVCHTRNCQAEFKATIIGFVRGVLSHQRYGWMHLTGEAHRRQRQVSFREAVDWCCQFLGMPIDKIEVDHDAIEKVQFAAGLGIITRRPEQAKRGVSRDRVRSFLKLPAEYYVQRGYSREVLDRYDVGLYPVRGKPLEGRVAVPVYDNDHEVAVGFTGRSIFPQCERCKRFHLPGPCPDPKDAAGWGRTAKWWNQDFQKESWLYNFWFAREEIRRSGLCILVEGPGDVWRLEEAGIHVGLGMFGVSLSDQQQVILETSGTRHVVALTDQDGAGDEARARIRQRLGRMCHLHFPLLTGHDLGDMSVEKVRAEVLPVLEKIKAKGY